MNDPKRAVLTDENREESKRLRAIWDERHPRLSQAEFGEMYEIGSQAAVGHFLNGHSAISLKAAKGFARGLGCDIASFSERLARQASEIASFTQSIAPAPVGVPVSPRDHPPEGYVRLEHLSPRPSMGPGNAVGEPIHIVRHLDVLESWVRQKVGSADYDRVKILTGCGQSMQPTIQDNDLVFVDISERTIDIPGIYVIDVHGRFLLKRALILSDGTLVLKSDNRDEFPDEERIDLRRYADTVNVAGRVKAWWTLRQG
ncbi:helix-turn-helix transcriptional regulator [Diaphorobacter caeni]|uniref:helix-turn-helix transcriptional regulator n=1 Tax=Diaphorobacter caeni TaxID=2784387 RepID=UPI00188E4236|nr:helix-turn-helix transcriptional regulator [Diaphorobacter caeni]MBF5006878.1 helix-turn-helix transcriptional regulator [Diaphorobacter caeni]